MFSITPPHRHGKQRQGPRGRGRLGVRVRRQGVFGLVATATLRGGEVMAHLIGALPLLEGFGAHSEGARAHGQQHDERPQQEGHHRPEDAVHEDASVMGTPPQDVVRPEDQRKERKVDENRSQASTLASGR